MPSTQAATTTPRRKRFDQCNSAMQLSNDKCMSETGQQTRQQKHALFLLHETPSMLRGTNLCKRYPAFHPSLQANPLFMLYLNVLSVPHPPARTSFKRSVEIPPRTPSTTSALYALWLPPLAHHLRINLMRRNRPLRRRMRPEDGGDHLEHHNNCQKQSRRPMSAVEVI